LLQEEAGFSSTQRKTSASLPVEKAGKGGKKHEEDRITTKEEEKIDSWRLLENKAYRGGKKKATTTLLLAVTGVAANK